MKRRENKTTIVLSDHIKRPSGSWKTICVSSVLHALGIPVSSYHSTTTKKNLNNYETIIRRNGYALRSRKSHIKKPSTVGSIRKKIKNLQDPLNTVYLIRLRNHVLLLDQNGDTIVDTDPKIKDRRQVFNVQAIWKK